MGCGSSQADGSVPPQADGSVPPVNSENPTAIFDTTMGVFTAELYLDKMPITASNFIDLSNTGFYNGLHFHRVIPEFMNQFGCPHSKDPKSEKSGTGGPTDGEYQHPITGEVYQRFGGGNIKDEYAARITNAPGTLSMANTGQKDSGGSQIFLNVAANSNLDHFSPGESRHPVFGRVIEGYDKVVVAISKVKRGPNDNPIEPVKMLGLTIMDGCEAEEDDDCVDDAIMAGAVAGAAGAAIAASDSTRTVASDDSD